MRNILAACAALAVLILGLGLATGVRSQSAANASPTPAEEYCATPLAQMTGTPAAGQQGQAQTAPTIEMVDIGYKPNQLTIPANTDVTLTLKNTGQLPHTFDIDALNIHSDQVQPGQTATVKINAAAGSYQFYCREPGHKDAGMVGTLTVQ